MFRRSLIALAIATGIVLLVVVVYAGFNQNGPELALGRAADDIRAGAYKRAIVDLDRAEHSTAMQRRDLRLQLLQLRYRAHKQLDGYRAALRDLEALLQLDDRPEATLLLDRIWLLARLEDGPQAQQRARTFLADHPDDPRGLELAGEACQVAYRDDLKRAVLQVRRDVSGGDETLATRAALAYLYRPDGDPGVSHGMRTLARLYGSQTSTQSVWLTLLPQLAALRPRVQEALELFQRSLEAGGKPIAAWRGMSFALEQAGRTDDQVALAEIYWHAFDHRFTAEAAAAAAQAHLRDGLDDAVLDVANRFLPDGNFRGRYDAGKLAVDGVQDLLVAKALALWHQRDRAGLDQLAVMAAKMATAGLPIHLAQWLSNGFLCRLVGDQKNAGLNLEAAASQLAGSYPPLLGEDPLAVVMQLRIDLARERGAKVSEVIDLLQNWAKASGRADRIEPLLAKVRYQLEAADPSAALASADEALRRAPQDEAVLRLLAQTAERAFESAGQNAAGLLQQCRRSRSLVPDSPPHPICYLLCGEAALHEHELPVAHGCGLKAIDKFTWSAWPRRLVGKALADDPTHAVAVLQELHALHPDDQEGVLLLLEARARAGQSIDDLVFDALRVGAPGPLLATALLRAALRSGDIPSLQAIAHSQAAGPQPSVEQQALLAQAAATSGDFAAATTALHAAASALTDDADRARRSDLATAVAAVLAAQLPRAADQELAQQTRWWQGQLCGSLLPAVAQTFLDSATRAAAAGKPQTAYALLTTALGLDGAAAARNGAVFTQAGRLALRLHCWQDAEHHFTAAVSFADGAAAAEPLARLHLLQRHDERAAQALRLCQQPRDAALAQRLDDPATAQRLLRSALASDADDLLAQCTMAASAQVAASALGAELRELEGPARADCLLLLSLLADPDLGELAVPRAEALLARLPDSHAARLLLARAQSDAGQAAAAARLHAQVFADGCRDGVLLAEAVRAASRPDYLMPAALQAELRALLPQPGALANDRVQAFAVRELAATTALAGHPELARRMLADFWIRHPAQSGARVADAVTLFVQGQQQDALRLFIALVPVLTGDERLASLRGLFSTALALASASDDQTSAIVRTIAWTVLEQDGAFGPALHFLLTDDRRAQRTDPSAPVTAARARELLRAHLERCADGREDVGSALWSLRLLEERCGSDEALLGVEHLLQRAPALLPAWLWRAQLLQRLQRPGEGLSDLRHLLQIANDPQLVVAVVTLAGELRACTAADRQLLADLPREMLSQPAVQFAGGLLLLRAGRADAALPLLGAGPPRDDGSHLYFRALAALACSHANAREQAGPLFAQLAADYPNSSLARYAGSFARQLAPR